MSVIEQAAKRLEELRRAGIDIPGDPGQNTSRSSAQNTNGATVFPATSTADAAVTAVGVAEYSGTRSSVSASVELDLPMLAKLGFVTPDSPRSRIADEFRIVKRPLIANASGKGMMPIKNGNLIMMTNAVPDKSKTFSAINLAMSIAMELDQTVLLVDADVARPSLPRVLGLPSGKGLLDALHDKSFDLDHAFIRTNVEKLSILTNGTQHARATELLASDAMDRLLHEMATRYPSRIVVFDSPPLLMTTEARVLATHMGQIVFVVQAEATLKSEVKRALAMIETCPVKMILLNQARTVAQGAYGYGYGDN